MSGDSYFTKVKTLLHFEGANNGVVFTDVVGKVYNNDSSGSVTSTTTARYGTTSGKFTASAYIYTNSNTGAFNVGTGDFTIEISVKTTAVAQGRLLDIPSTNGYYIDIKADGTVLLGNAGGTFGGVGTAVNDNAWHDIAIQRLGTSIYIHVDGTLVSTSTSTVQMGGTTGYIYMGMNSFNAAHYVGYMDEYRFTAGVARYGASNYTPAAFPNIPKDIYALLKNTRLQKNLPAARRAASLRYIGL
jgi:Concanavalin A-like lectin/glucanases superfamily